MNKTKRAVVVAIVVIMFLMVGCTNNKNSSDLSGSSSGISETNEIPKLVKSVNTVNLKNIKYTLIKINSKYNSVGWVSGCCGDIFFSAGTDKPSAKNPPCLTYIEKLFEYNAKSKKLTEIASIDKGFVQIDWVNADKDWIVYREIKNEYGGVERIYAINRKTRKKSIILEHEETCNGGGILSNHPFNLCLSGDYLVVPEFKFKPLKRNNQGDITEGTITNKLNILNLNTGNVKTIFTDSSSLERNGAIFSVSAIYPNFVFNYANGTTQTIYHYSFESGILKKLGTFPLLYDKKGDSYLSTKVVLTENQKIIFIAPIDKNNGNFGIVVAPVNNINDLSLIAKVSVSAFSFVWPSFEPVNYIIWENRYEGGTEVFNTRTGKLTLISGLSLGNWISENNFALIYMNTSGNNLIIIDADKNGF